MAPKSKTKVRTRAALRKSISESMQRNFTLEAVPSRREAGSRVASRDEVNNAVEILKPDLERAEGSVVSGRLHGLDNLRALAMCLGVTLHAVLPFLTEPGVNIWPVRSAEQGVGFDLVAGLIHSWRMQVFFILAGFFGRHVLNRRGWREFVKQRAIRLGVPFAVGMGTLAPLVWWQFNFAESPGATVHLWFLQYLIIYSAVAVLISRLGGWPASMDRLGRGLVGSRAKAFFCTIPTALLMVWSPVWDETTNARGATFAPNAVSLVYYALFFLFGWILHRHAYLMNRFESAIVSHFVIGFATMVGWGILYRAEQTGSLEFPVVAWPVYYLAGAANAWCFCFGLIGLFAGRLNRASKPLRYLADASYWIYLTHLPLVIALQKWIVPTGMGPWTKFFLINLLAFAGLLASYQVLVRYTMVGVVLNGRKVKGKESVGS